MAMTKTQLITALAAIPGDPEIAVKVSTQSTEYKLPIDQVQSDGNGHSVNCYLDIE